ncbi:type VII secretion target [Lolliginicoccus suaedae]|uniref:type VII secretion target n=1 Tax=Lolliginicoccus suaedae TaxID=2605429 RepID=UPI0011EF1298|nr:type VII secretion target [Lolliginicoccus suaedae]
MTGITADPAGIDEFGRRLAQQSQEIAGLADTVAALRPEIATNALGPIGAGFLAAYAAAQERYRHNVAATSAACAHNADAAHHAADLYRRGDADSAARLAQAGGLA